MRMTPPRRFLATTAVALATLTGSTVPGQAQTVTSSERTMTDLPGYQMLYSDPIAVDNLTPLTFECPAWKVAVSGGADVQGAGAVLVGSFPTLVGSSSRWTVVARQVGKPQVTLTAYMLCANSAALPRYQLVNLPSADVANRASREAACPAGKVVVSGGAETRGKDPALRVSVAPRPKEGSPSLWTASGQSLSAATVGLAVTAICANPVPGYEIVELPVADAPNSTAKSLACPSGKAPLSGGVAGYNTAVVTSSRPEFVSGAVKWSASVREPSRTTAASSLTVICAN